MLYERWHQIARERHAATALRETATGRQWTFDQLAAVSEGTDSPNPIEYPRGLSSEFIFTVLRAWRAGKVVCPLEAGQSAPPPVHLPPGIVHLKTTSATTGAARLVAFTAAQLAADADNIVTTMGLRPDWPNLGVISLAHSYGFSNLVLPLLLHGVPLIVGASPLPEAMRLAAQQTDALTLPAVPALWRAWHEADAIPANIKLAISAGAPLPLQLEQAVFARRGLKLHNFYGASECGGIAYDASETTRTDPTLAGGPLRNVSLAQNGEGCLEVRGAAVAETYLPETSPALAHGCHRTSDLVELSNGLVFVRGRAGDQINVAGRKISPETIERLLLAHPVVRECLVFGVPSADAERTDKIVACVTARSATTAESLRQFLLDHAEAWQVPRDFWFVESLDAGPRGKLSRGEWRQRYLSRTIP